METAFSNRESLLPNGDRHVQEVVRAAHDELRQLIRQRAEIMKRIGTVKQTIVGLANLFGDDVLSDELLELVDRKTNGRQPGFTKACRMVLMESSKPLDVLYLSALGRPPSDKEREVFNAALNPTGVYASVYVKDKERNKLYRDVLWALFNSNEFILNH